MSQPLTVAPADALPQLDPLPDVLTLWHDTLIDWMLLNPRANIQQAAAYFNRSTQHIHAVASSDLFRARYLVRKDELAGKMRDGLLLKAQRAVVKALDVVESKLDNDAAVSLPVAVETAARLMSSMGMNRNDTPQVVVQNNNTVQVSGDVIARAREKMQTFERNLAAATTIEAKPAAEPTPAVPDGE